MPALVRVVDELRDFDVDLPGSTPTIDFPDARAPEFGGWDRHGIHADPDKAWQDDGGVRWVNLLCARRSGQLFVATGRLLPLSQRRPGERCLVPIRTTPSEHHGMLQFWPCFRDLERRPQSESGK